MSREACHFPIYTENVKMSVPPAASGGDISQSKTAQISLLLAAKQMKTQPSFFLPYSGKYYVFFLFPVAVICLHAYSICAFKLFPAPFTVVRSLQKWSVSEKSE